MQTNSSMFGTDRNELRQMFYTVWGKLQAGTPLTPLEDLIGGVLGEHPEYRPLLENPEARDRDYTPEQGETNPFLHMAMHIAIREQLGTGQPAGIREAHQRLVQKLDSAHEAEHVMLECLGEALWQAQRSGLPPDEAAYLECVQRRAG